MAEASAPLPISPDFLIGGAQYLANRQPGFKLVGRENELNAALDALTRTGPDNNLILSGQPGTDVESVVMGLQTAATGKSFFYLDVDALFALNDTAKIVEGVQKALESLQTQRNPVLVINNTRDFLKGVNSTRAEGIINTLMRELREGQQFQAVFVADDEKDVPALLDAHQDLKANFIRQTVNEPSKDNLRAIVEYKAKALAKAEGVTVSEEAIKSVLDITAKYPVDGLPKQPARSLTVLKGAIATAKRLAKTAADSQLEDRLTAINAALEEGKAPTGELADKSHVELEAIKKITEEEIATEAQIANAASEMECAQGHIRTLRNELDLQQAKDNEAAARAKKVRDVFVNKFQAAANDTRAQATIQLEYTKESGDSRLLSDTSSDPLPMTSGSSDYEALQQRLEKQQAIFDKYEAIYKGLVQDKAPANDDAAPLTLSEDDVLAEFSQLSKLPLTKLKSDEAAMLMNLEAILAERVVGQPEAIRALAKAVRKARNGLKNPKKTEGVFIFQGPPGVGKTYLCEVLAEVLGYAFNLFDMTQCAEKHGVAKLIGAPPGYEGSDEEGQLTRLVKKNPKSINVFDEGEKAHPSAFNVVLRPFNSGVMDDNKGNIVHFENTLNVITTNLGTEFLVDKDIPAAEAAAKAKNALYLIDPVTKEKREKGFSLELMSRVNSVICFNRLESGQIEIIAVNTLKDVNKWLAAQGSEITIDMPQDDIKAMCDNEFDLERGVRSIVNYVEDAVMSEASDYLTLHPDSKGTLEVTYTATSDMSPEEIREAKPNVSAELVKKGAAPASPEKPAKKAAAKAGQNLAS